MCSVLLHVDEGIYFFISDRYTRLVNEFGGAERLRTSEKGK